MSQMSRVWSSRSWTAAMTGLNDAPGGKQRFVVGAGDTDGWDGERTTRDLRTFVRRRDQTVEQRQRLAKWLEK